MRGVPYRASLKPGTLIVSSGLGAVYPRGIPIGTVLGEVRTPEQWARTYLLRPSVQPANIAQVMLLLPTRVAAGVRDVWTSVPSADSATRAIVAAGDSALRETAMAEVRARRAALDSTGGDSLQADSTRADSVTPRAAVPARPVPPRTDSAPRTAPAGAPVRRDSTRPIPPAATVPRPATTTTPRPPVTRSPDTSRRPPAAPATKRP
jgi:rod shape-determining protein MreC